MASGDAEHGRRTVRQGAVASGDPRVGGTAAEIEKGLLDRLAKFRGECRPADDVTFVVIKVVSASV
jgi:serine phosphatase RsbU (regulator of sigma subunit)